jgi:hypothetical protein
MRYLFVATLMCASDCDMCVKSYDMLLTGRALVNTIVLLAVVISEEDLNTGSSSSSSSSRSKLNDI